MNVGAGYNPNFLENTLTLPEYVSFIEGGLQHLPLLDSQLFKNRDFSLHLARTPIAEDKEQQASYIKHLLNKLHASKSESMISIGVHLTGARDTGIGNYGFSSHFNGEKNECENAIRFIETLSQSTQKEIWVENINFYSCSINKFMQAWEKTIEIIQTTGSKLILDFSHLAIDLLNIGCNPHGFISKIPWEWVGEIHLSGIIKSHDGTYHDNHGLEVPPLVWDLFDHALSWDKINENTIVTIEHTDACWAQKKDIFFSEYEKLNEFINYHSNIGSKGNQLCPEIYARKYLHKILCSKAPALFKKISEQEISSIDIVNAWLDDTLYSQKLRLVLHPIEVIDPDREKEITESFFSYIRENRCLLV